MQLPTHIDQLFQDYLNAKARYNTMLGTYDEMYDKHQVYLTAYNEWLGASK